MRFFRNILVYLAVVFSLAGFVCTDAQMQFTNVTTSVGISHRYQYPPFPVSNQETQWSVAGTVAEDFDGDGWIDLYVLQTALATNHLYMNYGGTNFVDEAAARGAALSGDFSGAAAADFDNDGDVDLCITQLWGPVLILRNLGAGTFAVDTNVLQFSMTKAMSPSWGDVDNDGLLDLALSQWDTEPQNLWLFRNTGTKLVQYEFRLQLNPDQRMFSPYFADVNNDGLSDLLAVGDFHHSQLYLNRGQGLFERTTDAAGVGTDENGMGTAVADYDADGDLDWFISSISDPGTPGGTWDVSGNRLYRNNGDGTFADATDTAGVRDGNWGWGSQFGDFDNDGDLDLFHVNGWPEAALFSIQMKFNNRPARLFENQGNGEFVDVAASAGADDSGQGRGLVVFDFDNDGDLDLFIANNQELFGFVLPATRDPGPPVLLRNDSPSTNHWLKVTLAGSPPLHRDGIGSRIYLTAGGLTQMRELNASSGFLGHGPARIAHFGLGTNSTAGEIRAEWAGGNTTIIEGVGGDAAVVLPSPSAVLSKRNGLVNEIVTACGTGVPPIGNPREWLVENQVYADPLQISFPTIGTKSLRLNVYELDGTTLLRSEIHRIRVQFQMTGIASIPGGSNLQLSWECVSGQTYQVEFREDPDVPVWRTIGEPLTAGTNGICSVVVTNGNPRSDFRVGLIGSE